MKTEHLTQELLDSLQSNERLRESLRALGEEDLLVGLAEPPEPPFIPSEAALTAALCVTFSLERIQGPAEQVDAVVRFSSVQVVNGQSRLKLDDGYRGKVLLDARRRGTLDAALVLSRSEDDELLDQLAPDPAELESAWLRQWLRREPVDLERYAHLQVSAAYRALLALGECASLLESHPGLREVQRQMQWLDLVEPLRLMIGAAPGRSGSMQAADRFAGRAEELRTLRAFVDELASEGLMESASRTWSRVKRSFLGKPRMLMLSARGGLGKSTLISKFAYDHAVLGRGMPFAYLDFDSAVLQPRNPLLLLAEVARQVALFYPRALELESFVDSVRRKVLETAGERGELIYSRELFQRFRELLQRLVADHSARCFLLVLDTLELVQSDATALEMVQHFLDSLIEEDFPELVVVASGRAQVPELYEGLEGNEKERWSVEEMELAPLSASDAALMVQLLGSSLLPDRWQAQWSKRMVGKSLDSASREPLSLRIAVEAVRDAEPASREALVAEIAAMGEGCDPKSIDFVGRLYQKRILEHIANHHVRQLAWPGLVARSISEKLAREVLAPECGLTAEEAGAAFQRLKREVWIVTPEGDELRHRSDLRARTLPLMRRHDEVLFKKICGLMSAHHLGKHPPTVNEQAQAGYYQVLADDTGVTRMLDEEGAGGTLQQLLVQRLDDFAADSRVVQDLKVRRASRELPTLEFNKLPLDLAWRHVAQSGGMLKNMVSPRIDHRVVRLSRSLGTSLGRGLNATEQTILIKTGRWQDVSRQRFVPPEDLHDVRAIAFMGNFLTSITELEFQWMDGFWQFLKSSTPENWDWMTLSYLLLPCHRLSRQTYLEVDRLLAERLPVKPPIRLSWAPALRLALACGIHSQQQALRLISGGWTQGQPRGLRFSEAELNILRSSTALKGHLLLPQRNILSGVFGTTHDDRIMQKGIFAILREAFECIERGGANARYARQDIRKFALEGRADLASPAGYLLKLCNRTAKELKGHLSSRKSQEGLSDPIQICSRAEDARVLSSVLRNAVHNSKEEEFSHNLELLQTVATWWGGSISKHFHLYEND